MSNAAGVPTAGADDSDRITRFDVAIQHATLVRVRQNVAEQHNGLEIKIRRDPVQARVRMRDAHVLGLGTIDRVPQDPATSPAMGRHAAPAEIADAAGGDAGDEHEISWVKGGDARANCLNHAHTLVSENAARGHAGNVTFQDMKVRAANGRCGDANDGVASLTNRRRGLRLPRSLARAVVDQCLHDAIYARIIGRPIGQDFNAHGSLPRRR